MADPPPWPSYPIGPPGAALAIGVASVNYARLEFAFGHMFATVTGVTNEEAWRLLPTLRNPERIRRIRKALRECDWPPDTKDRVNHFIDAFKIIGICSTTQMFLSWMKNLYLYLNIIQKVKRYTSW